MYTATHKCSHQDEASVLDYNLNRMLEHREREREICTGIIWAMPHCLIRPNSSLHCTLICFLFNLNFSFLFSSLVHHLAYVVSEVGRIEKQCCVAPALKACGPDLVVRLKDESNSLKLWIPGLSHVITSVGDWPSNLWSWEEVRKGKGFCSASVGR